jgi:hypothetical protein
VISRAAEERIDGLIFTFAFERTVRDGFIRSLRNAVETRDGELILVNLKASTDEMEKRMGDPARKAFGKLNSVQQFRELNEAGAFSHPEIPADGISFDTTNLSPSAAALKIADAINGSGQ